MAMLDISLVTETLGNLLQKSITASDQWSGNTKLAISYNPPDKLKGDSDYIIGLYLYHIVENEYYENLPPPENVSNPIRYTPMGLNLYYLLTALSKINDSDGQKAVLSEQLMMGLAIKALRDCPTIDDSTVLHGEDANPQNLIMAPKLRDQANRLNIELLKVDNTQAVGYWTAGSSPLRLAAYYKVSVALLEPYKIERKTGRVLAYGSYVFTSAAPRLFNCTNRLSLKIPGRESPQQIEIEPAQAPVGDTNKENSTISFQGTGLTGGQIELYLRHSGWEKPLPVDGNWAPIVTENEIRVTVQKEITPAGGAAVKILPGMYSAFVKRTISCTLSDGTTRNIEYQSNEIPFIITAYIESVTSLAANHPDDIITVKSEIFDKVDAGAINVYVADEPFKYKSGDDDPGGGQFVIKGIPKQLKLKLSKTLIDSWNEMIQKAMPFRLLVSGCESPPCWILQV